MPRPLSHLAPALVVALATLAASALAKLSPRDSWLVVASPLCIVAALIGADFLDSRQRGDAARSSFPRPLVLLLAGALLAAFGLVATAGADRLVEMIPILGGSVAMPFVIDRGRPRCRRA